MFAHESPPDFDVPGRREPGNARNSWPKWAWWKVACPTGEVGHRRSVRRGYHEPGGGEAVGAGQPLRRDADELLEPLCQMCAADTGCHPPDADRHRPAGRRDDTARMA